MSVEETPSSTPPEKSTEITEPTEVIEPTEPTDESLETPTEPTEPPIDVDNIEESLKNKGFNYQELLDEYNENGDILSETRDKLNEIGISDEFIDDFINGKKALSEQRIAKEQVELSDYIGGKDKFDEVIKWAAENLSKEEIKSLNAIREMNAMKMILSGLKSRMEEKEGVVPNFVKAGSQSSSAELFESQAQMFEAIRDKRYNRDPVYTQKVTAKIRASREAGINLGNM